MGTQTNLTPDNYMEIILKADKKVSISELMQSLSFKINRSTLQTFVQSRELPYRRKTDKKVDDFKAVLLKKHGVKPVTKGILKLQIGHTYKMRNNMGGEKSGNKPFQITILKEYTNYYLGELKSGVKTTIFKYGGNYAVCK